MESNQETECSSRCNFLWWIMKTVCIPLSLPILLLAFWKRFKETKNFKYLPGKVVVITGASSGLGEALAHEFYKAGCKIVLAARRIDELNRVKSDLLRLYTTIPTHPPVVIPIDLSDLNTLTGTVNTIMEVFGQIDILINNGGISVRSDILSSSIDVDIKVMLVNYFGSVGMTKAVLPSMIKRQQGRIVFINSVQGKFALPYRSAYSASKHALQAFSDSLRAEVAAHGIKVTNISPGYIKTSLSMNALTNTGSRYGKMDASTETGASPQQIANDILRSILRDEKDIILAQPTAKLAYWLRFWFPTGYFWVMNQRAEKLANCKED